MENPIEIITTRDTCRICGSPKLVKIIDLGTQYLASNFWKNNETDADVKRYPLELVRCSADTGCNLIQLRHSISPDVLYSDYGYLSGINEAMRDNLSEIVEMAQDITNLNAGDAVLDIGCNDGTLLCSYNIPDIMKIGFEPSLNAANIAIEQGLDVIKTYFSADAFRDKHPDVHPRIITSIAMFYDLEAPLEFVQDIADILAYDGIWIMELSYLPLMLERNAFDTICHEHLEYYSIKQIEWMLNRVNLEIYKLELNDINGGSFRLFIQPVGARPILQENQDFINKMRQREIDEGFNTGKPYKEFYEKIISLRDQLLSTLQDIWEDNKTVYGYGASTKGNTLLQFYNIDSSIITAIAERNPSKWGRYTPGTLIPIESETDVRAMNPDYMLVLPWHFMPIFIERERNFLENGGKFIVPLPEVRIIGKEALS